MRRCFLFLLSAAFALGQPAPPACQPGGGNPGPGGGPAGAPPPRTAGDGVWLRNAIAVEGPTFDYCEAHQPGSGTYHYHENPVCLRYQLNDNLERIEAVPQDGARPLARLYREKAAPWKHSPILGWASDGYPIYGPYGYSDPADPASEIARMRSSFRLRDITERHALADWSAAQHNLPAQLPENLWGPDISAQYPLGRYVEDFEYVEGLGDLDVYNGRFTVTPEFPKGTYAYFVTIDEDGESAFPYVLGRQWYGSAVAGMVRDVTEPVTDYFSGGVFLTPDVATAPEIASWRTISGGQLAQVIGGFDPAAGPQTVWPSNVPAGSSYCGGQSTPVAPDVQRIRYSDGWVYINASGLAGHIMGPWYDDSRSGVFPNWPSDQRYLFRLPRQPQPAGQKQTNMLGAVGLWVNGVAVFNMLDGAAYSHAAGRDAQ